MTTVTSAGVQFFKATGVPGPHGGPVGVSVPGVKVGDAVLIVDSPSGAYKNFFEQFISVDDEIQYTVAQDISYATLSFLVVRPYTLS